MYPLTDGTHAANKSADYYGNARYIWIFIRIVSSNRVSLISRRREIKQVWNVVIAVLVNIGV